MDKAKIISTIKQTVREGFSVVIFENGTYVIPDFDKTEISKEEALEILVTHGGVNPGSPSGDFCVFTLTNSLGWTVGVPSWISSQIYSIVCRDEIDVSKGDANDVSFLIGVTGREKRLKDFQTQIIIYPVD